MTPPGTWIKLAELLTNEVNLNGKRTFAVAWRKASAWCKAMCRCAWRKSRSNATCCVKGVYLITGGLGNVGSR